MPFIIYALPRSRTAWLSRYLTYLDWTCYHEVGIRMREVEDIKRFFYSRPNVGCSETAAGPLWQIIKHHVPDAKRVVIRRPLEDVMNAMMNLDLSGVAYYEYDKLKRILSREIRDLEKISAEPDVLTVDYADLKTPEACAAIFEHVLPYRFDYDWWRVLDKTKVEVDVKQVILYYYANKDGVDGFKKKCKSELRRLAYAGLVKGK